MTCFELLIVIKFTVFYYRSPCPTKRTWSLSFRFFYTQNGRNKAMARAIRLVVIFMYRTTSSAARCHNTLYLNLWLSQVALIRLSKPTHFAITLVLLATSLVVSITSTIVEHHGNGCFLCFKFHTSSLFCACHFKFSLSSFYKGACLSMAERSNATCIKTSTRLSAKKMLQ